MELVKSEIRTFNTNYHPIGTLYWLSIAENRAIKRAGAIIVAFGTEEKAQQAIRNRLFIAGISVRVEKLYSTPLTTQCWNYQGYGYMDSYCKRKTTCRLCAGPHNTKQYYCTTCHVRGSECPHLEPKYNNYKAPHPANTRTCEIRLAITNKDQNTLAI
jgi:hypothetical protein